MIKYLTAPQSFILQWHITERCNWNCQHCYREDNPTRGDTTFDKLTLIMGQYVSLIRGWDIKRKRARIHLAGGEPLLHADFFKLAELFHHHGDKFEWSVFSNGSMINESVAKKLKKLNIHSCQISIEGCEKINDAIRGAGSFKKILNAIKVLTAHNIVVRASLTLTRNNLAEIPKLIKILNDSGVSFLNTRRLVPQGRGRQLLDNMLNKEEQFGYYRWAEKTNQMLRCNKAKLRLNTGCDSGIFNNKKPPDSPTLKNFCGIINGTLLVVMPNGDVMPCRRLPIILGNVFEKGISEIWTSPRLKKMRDINNADDLCRACANFEACFGGAKCVTYACTGNYYAPDVLCVG